MKIGDFLVQLTLTHRLYVFGGRDSQRGSFGDMLALSAAGEGEFRWVQLKLQGTGPSYISGHTGVVIGGKLFVFGGRVSGMKDSCELFALNLKDLTWSLVKAAGDQPIAVDGHSAVEMDGLMVVFGGFRPYPTPGVVNCLQVFNPLSQSWCIINEKGSIPGRCYHGAVVVRQTMWVYSGMGNGSVPMEDLWKWDLERGWQFVGSETKGPGVIFKWSGPRHGHSIFTDGERILIFGGSSQVLSEKNDLWAFDVGRLEWSCIQSDELQGEHLIDFGSVEPRPKSIRKGSIKKGSIRKFQQQHQLAAESDSLNGSELSVMITKRNRMIDLFARGINKKEETKNASQLQRDENKEKLPHWDFTKKQLLESKPFQFESEEEQKRFLVQTPLTLQMQQSIEAIEFPASQFKKGNGFHAKYLFKPSFKKSNVKPLARDGATITPCSDGWILFGGDRHKAAFNDIWVLKRTELVKFL